MIAITNTIANPFLLILFKKKKKKDFNFLITCNFLTQKKKKLSTYKDNDDPFLFF